MNSQKVVRLWRHIRFSQIGLAQSHCLCAILLLTCAQLLAGCAPEEQSSSIKTVEYTVRGKVISLPDPASPASQLQLHHEPIPHFRATWPDGALGMRSMIMPFDIADGVTFDEVKVGDILDLTFAVDYDPQKQGRPTGLGRVVRYEELDAKTELIFTDPSTDRTAD